MFLLLTSQFGPFLIFIFKVKGSFAFKTRVTTPNQTLNKKTLYSSQFWLSIVFYRYCLFSFSNLIFNKNRYIAFFIFRTFSFYFIFCSNTVDNCSNFLQINFLYETFSHVNLFKILLEKSYKQFMQNYRNTNYVSFHFNNSQKAVFVDWKSYFVL